MLIDNVLNVMRTPFIMNSSLSALTDDLIASSKFFITEEVVNMAQETIVNNPFSLIESLAHAVPPYPLTWIEYNHKGIKFGLLIKQTNIHNYEVVRMTEAGPCLLSVYVSLMVPFVGKNPMNSSDIGDILKYNDKQIESAKKLSEHVLVGISSYSLDFFDDMRKKNPASEKKMIQDGIDSMGGLAGIIPAILILLNTKNIIKSSDCGDFTKINKQRVKSNKLPIQDYKILDLSFEPEVKRCFSTKFINSEESRRLHWRRGHFKKRKTGLYWWTPHLAGKKELGFLEKDYNVNKGITYNG